MEIQLCDCVEKIVGKGEIACMCNFSFSHNVFKSYLLLTHQNEYLCSKGLTLMQSSDLERIGAKHGERELNESMDRRTGCCNIIEIILKTTLNGIQFIKLLDLLQRQ